MGRNQVAPARGFQKTNDRFSANKSQSQSESSSGQSFFLKSTNDNDKNKTFNHRNDGFFVKKKTSFGKTDKKETNKFQNSTSGTFSYKNTRKNDFPRKQTENKFKGGKIDKNADNTKKPFDKKKWRLQKYSKKYKLEQWEDKRKKAVLREYYKEIKDDKPKVDVKKIYEQYAEEFDSDDETPVEKVEHQKHNYVRNPNYVPRDSDLEDIEFSEETEETAEETQTPVASKAKPKLKSTAFKKARLEFERLKQEKQAKKEEQLKNKAEKEEALKVYKKKKTEKFKKLNKKTKKGQPIMKDRIEMLLEKIQSG